MELENRLKRLESRLSYIEKFLGDNFVPKTRQASPAIHPAPVQAAPAAAAENTSALSMSAATDGNYRVPNYAVPDPSEKASLHFIDNNAFNRKMLNNTTNSLFMPVAALGFLLVSFFIIRFSIDTGWLTPLKQIFIASLVGITFIGTGFWFKEQNNEYIRYLPLAGIGALLLAAVGSSNFYHFFPRNSGFLFVAVISISCLLLYQEFKHGIYLIVAAVAAYIIPLYIANESNLTLTNSYFVFISLAFAGLAFWLNLRPVYLMAAYLALAVSAIAEYSDADPTKKVIFILAHFLIFSGALFAHTLKQKLSFSKQEIIAFSPLILFFFIIEYYYIDQTHPYMAPAFILVMSLLLAGIYFKTRQELKKNEESVSEDVPQAVQS